MADSSPQGRLAVAKALRELTAAGYYRVVRVRQADGTFVSEAHVYDSPQTDPQVAPAAADPGSGGAAADHCGSNPVKDLGKEPSLPAPRQEAGQPRCGSPATTDAREGGREAVDPTTAHQAQEADDAAGIADGPAQRAAGEALLRVVGPEPRLRLGSVEALALAPQVARLVGARLHERDLATGPADRAADRVHSATALLRERLVRKLPPVPAQGPASGPAPRRWRSAPPAAIRCGRRPSAAPAPGSAPRTVAVGAGEAATRRGAARVRAALRPRGRQPSPSGA